MSEGDSTTFEYLTWDRTAWEASLENLKPDASFGFSDPDFTHKNLTTGESHSDKRIAYITGDGSLWQAECNTHSSAFGSTIKYTFKHFKDSNLTKPDHESDGMRFLAPGDTPGTTSTWELNVLDKDRGMDIGTAPIFHLKKII